MATIGEQTLEPFLPFSSHARKWGMPKGLDEPPSKKTYIYRGNALVMDQKLPFRRLTVTEGLCTGPSTPKHAEGGKVIPPPSSKLESLPLRLLEDICQRLTIADLCRLSQVSKFCEYSFSRDEIWAPRAGEARIAKAVEGKSWKANIMAAKSRLVNIRPLKEAPVYVKGDLIVIDPFKVYFTSSGDENLLQTLRDKLEPYLHNNTDCVVTYRGVPAVFITCMYWDSDTAFEVSRKGVRLGVGLAESKVIAAIPKDLVDTLKEENGTEVEGGVPVEGVDGELRNSRDGDFIILDSSCTPTFTTSCYWTYDEALEYADVMCASGGSWTFSDDSDEEFDATDMTADEIAKVLGEEEE